MLYERVFEKAMYVSESAVNQILIDYDINVDFIDMEDDGRLCISESSKTIYLRYGLSNVEKMYVILHELGHFFIDVEDGEYTFTAIVDKNRSEFKAHLFACLWILKNVDLMNLNMIQYLINHGCPESVASNVFDYIEQNMPPHILMKFANKNGIWDYA